MPSPSKRYSQRSSPSRRGGGAGNSSLEQSPANDIVRNRKNPPHYSSDEDEMNNNASQQQRHNSDPTMVGKRTGVTLPPRGQIKIGDDGLEDPDAFFAAAKSPAPPGSLLSGETQHGGNSKQQRAATKGHKKNNNNNDERQREYLQLEKEGDERAKQRPNILNDNYDDEEGGEGGERKSTKKLYQQTPKQPGWSNKLMHHAMGVPTEDSPAGYETVLSKVSTAAPSTHGSLDTIATESRHALRGKMNEVQLDNLGNDDTKKKRSNPTANNEEEEEEEQFVEEDEGPMDPPEEEDVALSGGGKNNNRGVDPEERDDVLEPDALENSLEEVVQNNEASFDNSDDGGGEGGMQFATQQFDDNDDVQFDGGNDGGFDNDLEEEEDGEGGEEVSAKTSQKSRASSKSGKTSEHSEEEEEPQPKKKKKSKKKQAHDDDESTSAVTPTSVLRTKKSKGKKKQTNNNRVNWSTPNGTSKGIPTANRDYEAIPVSDYKESYPDGDEPRTPGGSVLRRSRRARFQPLQFWKNEKLIYEAQREKGLLGEAMGDMPVVAGVQHALPTPYKEVKRKEVEKKKKKKEDNKKRKRKGGDDSDSDDDDTTVAKTPFDDKAIRKKHRINNGESGSVWSETLESATDIKIVSRIDNRTFSKLPLSSTRKKRESKVVGFASQSFHVPTDDDDLFPGYIAGNVVLPPRGIKDAEGVGLCSQVFNVGDCQPNSLEFALADPSGQDGEFDPKTAQRYLLSKGDMFQIPPGNVYRIENHSKTVKATLFWTIIKCTSRAEQEDDSDEDD